jgi:hypothetical protein
MSEEIKVETDPKVWAKNRETLAQMSRDALLRKGNPGDLYRQVDLLMSGRSKNPTR